MNRALAALLSLSLSSSLLAEKAFAEPSRPPTALAEELFCASDEHQAKRAIKAIAASAKGSSSLPEEASGAPFRVRAATVDALLFALAEALDKYPSLRSAIEETVLSWNYCDVFFGGEPWDITVVDGALVRVRATAPSDSLVGFRAWGFGREGSRARSVPALLTENPLGRGQREWFLGSVMLDQCFPHPITGKTVFESAEAGFRPPGARATAYRVPAPPAPAAPPWKDVCPSAAVSPPNEARGLPSSPKAALSRVSPVWVSTPAQGSLSSLVAARTPLGLSGNYHTSISLSDAAPSLGAGVTFTLAEFTFVRVGIDQRMILKTPLPTYSWGFGYNDWHPGTFSAEVNNWSIPLDRVNLGAASLDIGYKFILPTFLENYLGAGISLNIPFAGRRPTLFTSFTIKPYKGFFVLGGFRFSPFEGPGASWVYSFGYSDFRPFTFSLQYNNFGPNAVFEPNFVKNGTISLAWSWAL